MSEKEAGAGAPLLPKHNSASDCSPGGAGASVSGAVFNVSTSIIGAGIMSIPATFKILGVIPAFGLIVFVALLADVSTEFLLRHTQPGVSTTYAGLMGESFGRFGSVLLQICILLANFGCLVVYLIIIADVLSGSSVQPQGSAHLGVLQEWFGVHWWNTRDLTLLFITVSVVLPLVLCRRVDSLRFSSAVAVFLAVVFVGISSVLAISAVMEGKTERPRLLPDLMGQTAFLDLFTAVPVIVTAFTFHFNVHPIGIEVRNNGNMRSAVRISLGLCAAIYFSIGFFGYLLFGESIMSDILVNFDRSSGTAMGLLLNDVVRLSYALHLVLVFPLLNFSLRANVDELLFSNKSRPLPPLQADTTRFTSLTLVLLASAYLVAIAIPDIWFFFQFVGSTSVVSIGFIFPGAIALRDVHGISSRRDKAAATVMVILAVATSLIAIFTNLYTISGGKS